MVGEENAKVGVRVAVVIPRPGLSTRIDLNASASPQEGWKGHLRVDEVDDPDFRPAECGRLGLGDLEGDELGVRHVPSEPDDNAELHPSSASARPAEGAV